MNHLIRAAIAASIVPAEEPAAVVKAPDPTLADFTMIPVAPGHPREPRAQRFEIDHAARICYVRQADWPKLQAALAKQRAAKESNPCAQGPDAVPQEGFPAGRRE